MKKTENRTETAVFKKPKPKTEPTEKKTDQKTENRNRPKKPKPTHHYHTPRKSATANHGIALDQHIITYRPK